VARANKLLRDNLTAEEKELCKSIKQ
jgi:hypothetical protein